MNAATYSFEIRVAGSTAGRYGIRDHVVTESPSWREQGALEAVHRVHARARWRRKLGLSFLLVPYKGLHTCDFSGTRLPATTHRGLIIQCPVHL